MSKPEKSLEVKNSNNQTGTIHQTDYKERCERLKEVLRKAIELQRKLDELSGFLFVDGEFDREFAKAQDKLQTLIHEELSPMLGFLYVNEVSEKIMEAV